jgi:predicted SAM-dependent methyltransferase
MAKVIVGAGGTTQPGWVSLEESDLDIRDFVNWCAHFMPNSLDAILAEHVLEHLSVDDARKAIHNCYEFLRVGGHLRIAVPDGHHPNEHYIDWVRPGGIWNRDDHKTLFDCQSLRALLEGEGFEVRLLEWHDEGGNFHQDEWLSSDGRISRYRDSFYSTLLLTPVVCARYSSLIVDAFKVKKVRATKKLSPCRAVASLKFIDA